MYMLYQLYHSYVLKINDTNYLYKLKCIINGEFIENIRYLEKCYQYHFSIKCKHRITHTLDCKILYLNLEWK